MAKKWSDVAGSSAFQALSLDEQEEARNQYFESVIAPRVGKDELDTVREQFFADTALRPRSSEIDLPSDITPSAGRSATPMGRPDPRLIKEDKGIIQRIGEFLKPESKSVMENYRATPEEMQAERDKRLSYGAGPIRPEVAAAAAEVNRGRAKTTSPTVAKVAKEMERRGERPVDVFAIAQEAKQAEQTDQERRKQFAEDSPFLGALGSGSAMALAGAINIPTVAADFVNQTAVNPVLRAFGLPELQRVPQMIGTEYLTKTAADYMPAIGNKSMEGAWNRDEFAKWLGVKLSANALPMAQSLAAAFAPPLRATLLPSMGATAAGQSYVQGDDSRVSVAKGLVEVGTEMLPLGVIDKIGDVLRGMGPTKSSAVLALAGQRLLQGGGVITANALTGAIEESAAQLGNNALDKYFQGKDIELTKGLAEAAVIGAASGGVMSAPQVAGVATGAYEPQNVAARQLSSLLEGGQFTERGINADVATELRTGSLTGQIRPDATVTNFTPPDSPTKQAGLVDIEVPVPDAPVTLPPVNPTTEQEFGLDKLRMGGSNVGTTGAPGGLAVPGSDVAGDLTGGSLGVPGLRAGDTGGGVSGSAGVNAPDGGKDVSAGGAGQQPLANLTRGYNNADGQTLVEPWFGRKGGGYTTEGDAQQALPGRQRMFPDLDWKIEAMPNGRYMLAGYTQETNLGTQTTQAQQGASQGQAQVAGSAGAGMGVPLAAGGIAPAADGTAAGFGELAVQPGSGSRQAGTLTSPEGAQTAGLTAPIKLAPPAPLRTVGKVLTRFQTETGVNVEIDRSPLTEQQQAASGLARMLGKTLTILKADTPQALPNGFVVPEISTKDIFVANDSDDAPLSVVVHEVYHTLTEDKRQALNAQLLTLFREDKRGEFAAQFGYDAKNDKLIDEEIPAFMAQAISKRADFWEQLREKMGNREFAGLAKVILDKLTTIVTGARKEYGDEFVNKYIKDVEKARDLLSTAYAESMQAQGLTPDTQAMPMAASNRSRVDMNFKDVIKRTPELQEGMAKLQAGEITKEDYNRLVNEFKPVEPYKSVPAPVTPEAARFALANGKGQSEEKAAKFGLPSRDMKAGEPTQLRLDIPSYSEHGAWVVSVHRPEGRSFGAGKVVGYEPVASVQNAEFGMLEKSAAKIAAGSAKGTIATIMGNWKPTTPAEAKLKADQALKSKDWVQVGMDPERHSYFYDRASMEPVVAADEVIQIGPLVLAKNPTYGKKSDFMFSQRVQEPEIGAKLRARIESDYEGAVQEYSQLKGTKGGRVLDADIARELSPEYRADRGRAPEVHEAVSDFIQRTFEERMAEPGTGDIVAFMAGGGGAGKSSAEELLAPILDQATTVLDGTLSSYDKAERNVQRVLDSGRQVRIVYVYRDPVDALTNGVLTRAQRTGRAVPVDALVKGHAGSSTVVRKLQEKFGDNPDFKLYAVDNSLGMGNAEIKDISEITPVIIDGLKERLLNATEQQLQAGQIDDKLYRATVGRQADAGTEAQSQVGGREVRSRLGGGVQEGGQLGGSGNPVIQFSKRAGKYPYSVDDKGRLTFTGDIDRVRFLTRQIATGTPTKDKTAVVFKAADADAVLEALKNEPKANARVAAAIVKKLGLTDAELKSTSLEFQTGEPGDRAFSAPLQGGIPETVQFLEDRRRQSGLRLLDIAVAEDQDTLARLIAAEALGAIRSSGNALEWYDETIARTLAMAAVKYPELGSDVNSQTVFRLAIAIASQGLNVENNLGFAMRQYDAFRNEAKANNGVGKFPEVGEGESAEAMVGNFRLANELMAEMGPDLFRRFLATEFTIGELNQAGFDPGGELVDEKVLGSSVFGPKIGFGFYSNLNGNFEPVTMDMWFMRTIGRLTGSLRAFDAEKFGAQLDKFRAAFGATGTDGVYASRFDADLVARARESQEAAIELARQVKKAHERDFRENRAAFDAGERKKTKLVYAAETMIQSVDKPKDVPASGGERRLLREVVRKAVATLEQAYGRRVPPAAMQALIWYPEQELYKALGVKLSVTSQDYAGAIEKILTKEGYDGNELRTAAESGSRRIRQADGGNARRSAQGDGQGAGQTRSLQGDERGGFIRSRYERTQLEQERVAPKRKGVVFEVAPDPNNAELTARWNSLSQAQRLGISERVAREIVPKVLERLGTSGIIANQVGSYEENTNPSFVLYLDKGDALEVAKALGFALAQDSVMVLSPKEFKGGEAVGALAIEIGNKTPAEVDAIYQSLREIEVKGERPIAGQSMANGVMTILNYSKVPTKQLALLVDQKLNKGYTILTRDVFAAFPDKKEYDYASEANDGRGSRADLRKWSRSVRAEATRAVERELGGSGIQRSNRATGLAEPARGSGARPDEGDAGTIVGVHYGTQANITSLSGDRYGSGLRGGERRRLDEPGVDPRIKKRVYFYLANNNADYPSAESGLGSHAYRANLDNMYDPSRASAEDKQRVRDVMQGSSANAFESAVLDAGFQGYVNREMGMAVVLNSDVPVEYEGTVLRSQMRDRNSPFNIVRSNRVKMAMIEEPDGSDARPGDEITVLRLASMPGLGNTNAASVKGLYTYLSMVDDYETAAGGEAGSSDTIFVYKVKVPESGFGEYRMQRGGKNVVSGETNEVVGRQKAKYGGYWYSFPQGTEAELLGSIPLTIARDTLSQVSDEQFKADFERDMAAYEAGEKLFKPFPYEGGTNNFDRAGTALGSKALGKALAEAGFDLSEGAVMYSRRANLPKTVKLADDLADQEKFLQQKAEAAGYKTIDEFVDKDYEGFAAAAKEWRDAYPVDVMYSNRAAPDTREFKRWFGDSKVVDAKGKPLVVYHGTDEEFTTFMNFGSAKGKFFFSPSQEFASDYGDTMAVYLSIQNPFRFGQDSFDFADYWGGLSDADKNGILFAAAETLGVESVTEVDVEELMSSNEWGLNEEDTLHDYLQKQGYDGAIVRENGVDNFIAYNNTQIKSAIGNNGEYDPNNPSIFASNRAREGWIVGRDELGRPTFGAGARAYRLVADVANNVLGRIGLKPISTDLGRAMRQMKVEIAKAREMTVDAAEQLGKLTQQEREMISDVIEGELKRGAKPPKRVLELAASMQGIMSEQTAELVRLGMLSEDAAGRWDGKYLPRFYESKLKDEAKGWAKAAKALLGRQKTMQGIGGSNLKGRGLFQTIPVEELEAWIAEGWEERDPNFDPDTDTEITVWRDYTREERDDMGEIRDAMFRFVMGYNKSQRDISLGRLYENLANTVASKKEQPGYVQVPRTNVEDTYARRYGKLAGMWVPQEVLDHLVAFDQSQQNELLKMYLKGMSLWKEGKTVLNPVSHANNVLSNVTMAHFAGVSYWDVNKYIGATRDLIKRAPMVTEAEDAGLWTGTMTQAELVQLLPDQLKVLAAKEESKAGKAVESVWNAMSFWLRKPMGKAYEAEDLYFRYLIYRDARQRGLEPADAVDFAQKYIFTYDDLPKTARVIRDFALPFFAYTYKVVPTLAETALQYPWRYAAPAAALYTVNAAMYAFAASLGGGEDEDWWTVISRYVTDPEFRKKANELEANERKNLPDWMKGASLSLGTQKSIRLGVDEATGLPVFLDVSRIFPGGDLFDAHNNAGGVPLLAPITPNNPILTTAAAMLFNKDTFRGKDLVNPLTDTSADAARIRAVWLYQQIAPAIAVGNGHFDRAMNVIANQVGQPINLGFAEYTGLDKQGMPVQAKYAAMQTVGIKARPIDLDAGESIQKSEVKKAVAELERQIRVTKEQEKRGSITYSQADREIEKIREKRQRLKDGLTIEGEERK